MEFRMIVLLKKNFVLPKSLCSILILPLLFSCKSLLKVGKVKDIFNHKIIWKKANLPDPEYDAELKPYVDSFVADARKYGVNITDEAVSKLRLLRYVDKLSATSGEGVVASCNRYYVESITQEGLKIYDEKSKWLSIEILYKESKEYTQGQEPKLKELVYHELFHCLLNKGHLPAGYDGIMSAVLDQSSQRVFTEWDQLVEEMFSPQYLSIIPDAP